MIGLICDYCGELIEIRLDNRSLYFKTVATHNLGYAPIEGIRLSKEGCIKEHPDLKDRSDWREESIKRLKEKLKEFQTETQAMEYIILELKKIGYKPLYKQRPGFRVEKL